MRALFVAGTAVAALLCALFVGVAPATAADIQVDGCVVDGATVEVTIDDDILPAFDGSWLALHNIFGEDYDYSQPVGTDNVVPPLCVVAVSGGVIDSESATWAWCMEAYDATCVEAPYSGGDVSEFDDDVVALASLLAWEYEQIGNTSSEDLANAQYRIWCVTDDYEHPSLTSWGTAPATVTTCTEFRAWLDSDVLPHLLTPSDSIAITGPSAPAEVGDVVEFTVDSTATQLELDMTGGDTLTLCPGVSEATLAGTTLTITDLSSDIRLCVTSSAPTTIEVSLTTASALRWPGLMITYDLDENCQILIARTNGQDGLVASASVTVTATPGTGLADTGTESGQVALIGLVVLLSGTLLLLAQRTRHQIAHRQSA